MTLPLFESNEDIEQISHFRTDTAYVNVTPRYLHT